MKEIHRKRERKEKRVERTRDTLKTSTNCRD